MLNSCFPHKWLRESLLSRGLLFFLIFFPAHALLNPAIPFFSLSEVGLTWNRLATVFSRWVLHSFFHVSPTQLLIPSVDFRLSPHIWAILAACFSRNSFVPAVSLLCLVRSLNDFVLSQCCCFTFPNSSWQASSWFFPLVTKPLQKYNGKGSKVGRMALENLNANCTANKRCDLRKVTQHLWASLCVL